MHSIHGDTIVYGFYDVIGRSIRIGLDIWWVLLFTMLIFVYVVLALAMERTFTLLTLMYLGFSGSEAVLTLAMK